MRYASCMIACRVILRRMAEDALMLSISGLRGVIGQSLTPEVAARYAAAIGQWLRGSSGKDSPRVVVGRDSRPSGEMIEAATVAGLAAMGCQVTILGIATTPGVAIMVEQLRADGGVVITASHNPIIWNGIKTLRHDGVAPPPGEAKQIIERFKNDDLKYADVDGLYPVGRNDTVVAVHTNRVLPHVDAATIRRRRPRVVLDSVHGAGGPETARLLGELGADVIHLYADPTGHFPHAAEPTAENLPSLGDAVREHGADVGFAQDPDADRLAIIDETGRYIGEEYTLALCAMHVLERAEGVGPRAEENGTGRSSTLSPQPSIVVANLSTSRMIDDIASRFGAVCLRTAVGEANVADAMRRQGAVIGGEGNGGVILPAVTYVRDSLVGIGLVLELIASREKPLSQIVAEIPGYAILKDKLPIEPGMAERAIERLGQSFRGERIDLQDGIRIDFDAEKRWVHLRPSNTEPILRIIAEAATESAARELIHKCRQAVEGSLSRGG